MNKPALTLPIRTLTPKHRSISPWVCRRCLATETRRTNSPGYDPSLPARDRIGPDGKVYRLNKTDFYLKKPLPQKRLPLAYLQHSTSELLHQNEKVQRDQAVAHKKIVGVVVSSGRMDKTVKVRVAGQTWNKHIGKNYRSYHNYLVHDPNNSLATGDVVELHRLRVSRQVRHVVASIVSPFGTPVASRPPIPSPDERLSAYKEKRFAKIKRRALRAEAAQEDATSAKEAKDASPALTSSG